MQNNTNKVQIAYMANYRSVHPPDYDIFRNGRDVTRFMAGAEIAWMGLDGVEPQMF
jgi:hypothetical protein